MDKHEKVIYPKGTKCTLISYLGTETPYTVIGYERGRLLVQACRLIFHGTRYFDTIADEIEPNPWGEVRELNWAPKYGEWKYGKYTWAYFGKWTHSPYCD